MTILALCNKNKVGLQPDFKVSNLVLTELDIYGKKIILTALNFSLLQ